MPVSTLSLMLGSYVQTPDGIGVIDEILTLQVRATVGQNAPRFYRAKDLEPIPITPEIMDKTEGVKDEWGDWVFDEYGFEFKMNEGYLGFYYISDGCRIHDYPMQYVHQAQIFFKAKTGNELHLGL